MLQHNLLALYLIILISSLSLHIRFLLISFFAPPIYSTLTCLHYYDFDLSLSRLSPPNNRMSPMKPTIYVMQVFRRRRLSSLTDKVCTWDASLKFQKSWKINKYPGTTTPRRRDGECQCFCSKDVEFSLCFTCRLSSPHTLALARVGQKRNMKFMPHWGVEWRSKENWECEKKSFTSTLCVSLILPF